VPWHSRLRKEDQHMLQVRCEGKLLKRGECPAGQRGRKGHDVSAVTGAALDVRSMVFEVHKGGQFGGNGTRKEVH
jgi:hypothetical protein